ncbi:1,4-dihydroxy-2-naphthoate octaprenyltransferase [Salsuginibacillus halophilus]|uniref:1,4-dihydroxy-2-naphthoate octaprenyltransferase n=1 Tax=Salsuginibacillus halophilus TaxID=517424 RepID=A0A2P8H9S5_9BACI|nr:1,4-dihydroxy-2-naphthoate octaprenyltransferase [Salsuginibacillus halophilus]
MLLVLAFRSILRGGLALLRSIAVVSSSVATIISAMLPFFLYSTISTSYLLMMFFVLLLGAFTIHGVLTHAFNDYMDYLSGTDAYSPAILSGGSRVIQDGIITPPVLWLIGKWLAIALLVTAFVLALFSYYILSFLLVIGVWAAASYSLPPLRLSYRPFLGEWGSLFPSILFLGLAGPWLIVGEIPVWAAQNAVINALFCLAWVMVHHIPDLDADKRAVPAKRTSVVWFADTFGRYYARFPALLYLGAAGLCIIWLGFDRVWATGTLTITISIALFLVLKMDVENHQQVSSYEKILLLLAMITAAALGIFI